MIIPLDRMHVLCRYSITLNYVNVEYMMIIICDNHNKSILWKPQMMLESRCFKFTYHLLLRYLYSPGRFHPELEYSRIAVLFSLLLRTNFFLKPYHFHRLRIKTIMRIVV